MPIARFTSLLVVTAVFAALFVPSEASLGQAEEPPRISVRVDPRVELMSLIFRLAGNPEYNQKNSRSAYSEEAEFHFGRFKKHPVITTAQKLRSWRGISYDAVMSMAVHISDTVTLAERIPFDESPPRLDSRWRVEEARDFLEKARDFVEQTAFNEFVEEHRPLYEAAAARLREKVAERAYLDWFDEFLGARPGAAFHAFPGLMNGGANYGVGIRFPDGSEEITPVIGVWQFDIDGVPIFGDDLVDTFVHELCHSYTNPIVDQFADRLAPAGEALYPLVATAMQRQAYGNWRTMMYESMVRACTIRHVLAHDGPEAAKRSAAYHEGRGFKWIGGLAELLDGYETDRASYPTLESFMPRVVAFFDGVAAEMSAQAARAPKVLKMVPANGSIDVDPDLAQITITFDRPMMARSWSVVGGGPDFPELAGQLSYDESGRVLTIPVRLKPGWTYRFTLNSEKYDSFRSRDGVPLVPVSVTFKTEGSDPQTSSGDSPGMSGRPWADEV